MNEYEKCWILIFTGILLHAIIGCAEEVFGTVNGFVEVGGKRLESGSILFQNATGSVSINADITADGSFVIRTFDKNGLPPGDYRVAVRPESFGGSGETTLVGQPMKTRRSSVVPEKYHDIRTSGLAITIEKGANPPCVFERSP